jgi:lipopolysaccharide transport system permease protein
MLSTLEQFLGAKDLIWAWTLRNIKARYQQSLLGWLWAIVQPGMQVIILTIIFTRFLPIDTGAVPYPIFSFVAVIPWTFLAASLSDMIPVLVNNMSLVTKIYFPREVLPFAAMLARLMDFFVSFGFLVLLILIYKQPIFFIGWLFLPLVLFIQLLLIVGIGLFLSAANVFFRDVQSMLTLGIQLWFYASPIIYPTTQVPENLRPYYFLNPMAGILETYRDLIIYGRVPGEYFLYSSLISIGVFILGIWFFKRVEFLFADIV